MGSNPDGAQLGYFSTIYIYFFFSFLNFQSGQVMVHGGMVVVGAR